MYSSVVYRDGYGGFCIPFLFFFFKQKTAYEMRISDWSSDVCSSDLLTLTARKHLENALVNALRIAPYQATEILDRHDNFHELDYLASPLHGTKALICEAHGTKTATAHLFRNLGKGYEPDRKSTRLNSSH